MKWKIHNVLDYAQRPTGRKFAECPFCNYLTDDFRMTDQCWKKLTNYCPNCGADMGMRKEEIEQTVEAIPVEWIERYMESVGRIGYVEVMLDDWKAEQARREDLEAKK